MAQTIEPPTPTPQPTYTPYPTLTAVPTYTPFPTLTPAPQIVQYVALPSGQAGAIEFTATAGDVLISALLIILIVVIAAFYVEVRNRAE